MPPVPSHLLEVRFCFDCADPTAEDTRRLRALARQLPPRTPVRVEGHADSIGSETYNTELSRRRAEAVAEVLAPSPIAPTVRWFGESRARGGKSTRDRRVDVRAGW